MQRQKPKVGETWQVKYSKSDKKAKVRIKEVGNHDLVWEDVKTGDGSRELFPTFWARFEPCDE